MRVFSGVVLGYLLFELLWYLLFRVTNTDPHAPASISFQIGAVVFGSMFALAAGFLASFVGGRPHFIAAWVAGAAGGGDGGRNDVSQGNCMAADDGPVLYGARCGGWRICVCAAPGDASRR